MGRAVLGANMAVFACACVLAAGAVPAQARDTILHAFAVDGSDGIYPQSALYVRHDGHGQLTLYGTTYNGGAYDNGTVYKVTPDGTETVLHSFAGDGVDGTNPFASLIADQDGNLYGTTVGGGAYNAGTVFKLAPDGTETVLYAFGTISNDGAEPYAELYRDKQGNLYGTTNDGGIYNGGTAFKLAPNGTETILHAFAAYSGDGAQPLAGLVRAGHGDFYGTTFGGGAYNGGTVFKLTPKGGETILHSFASPSASCTDGWLPKAGVILDEQGNLYGTTSNASEDLPGTTASDTRRQKPHEASRGARPPLGCSNYGVVFKLAPDGTETVLHMFSMSDGSDGMYPASGVIMDNNGTLYGTTGVGGKNFDGAVYWLAPDGSEGLLHSFAQNGHDAFRPQSGLALHGSFLYGTTPYGGAYNYGAVYRVRTTP